MTRRQFAQLAGWSTGGLASGLALRSLLAAEGLAAQGQAAAGLPGAKLNGASLNGAGGTADRVIVLFMSGGPSQVDTFDPKPELARLAGQDVPPSLAERVPKIQRAGLKNLMESPWTFERRGRSGIPISNLLPETARLADELCVIRSLTHRNPVHGPGECVALTGAATGNRPSLGAWSIYGLGRLTEELPAFVALNLHTDGMQYPQAAGWGAGFLPASLQGTVVDPQRGIRDAVPPAAIGPRRRRQEIQAIQALDRDFLARVGPHGELEARIRSYETAFRLQTSAPELFDLSGETAETLERYGAHQPVTERVARGLLLARRMVERGVRFVQVRVGGWDAHSNLKGNHQKMADRTDRPTAALLEDLRRRGLLAKTLVVWCGEFGRTPTMEGRGRGRDHSPAAYSVWLAGGGVRGGQVIGATDPLGYTVIERPVGPQDLHATALWALGIDARQLAFNHHGLRETPLGVSGGAPVQEAFS